VAKDLQLLEPPSLSRLEKPKPVSRPAPDDDELWQSDVEEFPESLRPMPSRLLPKRSWAGIRIALMLAVIILAGTVLYSQQSGSLAALGVNIDNLVSAPWKNSSSARAPDNTEPDRVAQLPMTYLQVVAPQASESLTGNPTGHGNGAGTTRDSSKPKTVDSQHLNPGTATVAEPKNPAQTDAKAKSKERSSLPRTLMVFDASFVRDKPRSDANITGMLEPGTRIRVQSKTGDYFRIRSLDKDREPISGYVHREDAFFEPAK
jgi:hypothetical protein